MNQTDPTADSVREQLLDALDFSYCQGLGYAEPAELLAAYDRERAAVVSPPPSRAAEEVAKHVTRSIFALKTPSPDGSTHYQSGWDDGLEAAMDAARDAVLAVLGEQADRAAVLRELIAKAEEWDGHITVQELRRLAVEAHDTGTQRCICGEPEAPGTVHRTDGPCYVAEDVPAPVVQQPKPVPPGCWYNAEKAEEAMRDEPLDEPGPVAQPAPCGDPQHRHIGSCHVYASPARAAAEQQPAAADGEETLSRAHVIDYDEQGQPKCVANCPGCAPQTEDTAL
ncbi:hypothetical protein ACR9VJ_26245 [Streptomyces sp. H49]|uniref:hypothetical protein n=1 Tax=Streptomyces sp. H49 TaxID=3444117 RepID=UPI003F4AB4D5